MTRKGKASRRQWKKLRDKWAEGAAVMWRYRRFGKLTPLIEKARAILANETEVKDA